MANKVFDTTLSGGSRIFDDPESYESSGPIPIDPFTTTLYRNTDRNNILWGQYPNGDAPVVSRINNFDETLSTAFQGGFNIPLHNAAVHPDYPSVTNYSSRIFDSTYTGGAGGIALDPNGTSFYIVGYGGAYNQSGQTSPTDGGIDSITELSIPTLVKNVDPTDITGFNNTT